MNTKDAIKHLKSIGWFVVKEGKNFRAHRIGSKKYCYSPKWGLDNKDYDVYSPRELVHLALAYSANPRSNTKIKKLTKKFDKKKNRAAERNLLSTKDEEKLDEFGPTAKIKEENLWNWD